MLPLRKNKRLFDAERPIYAQRQMDIGELSFTYGDEIPWRELEIAITMVQMWFRLRIVSHFSGGDSSPDAQEVYHPGQNFRREEMVLEEAPAEVVSDPELIEEAVAEIPVEETPAEVVEEAAAEIPVEETPAEVVEEAAAETPVEEAPAEVVADAAPEVIESEASTESDEIVPEAPVEASDVPAEPVIEELPDPQTDDGVGDEIIEAPVVVVTEETKKRSRKRG